ncbi:MAG: L-arabinose isomerase family protein [Saccharofermentanales bacterium]
MSDQLKIGLLPFYLELYDAIIPEMRGRIERFYNTISDAFVRRGIDVAAVPLCRVDSEFSEAIRKFEDRQVDCIVTLHLSYSPSLESQNALALTALPVIVLNTTETYDFSGPDGKDEIMYNHGIHGVQDMCNLMIRNGKQFFLETGHWEKSDVIDRVITRIKGVKIAANIRSSRVGIIGSPFKGMGDFTVPFSAMKNGIGIETIAFDCGKTGEYLSAVTDKEILAEMEQDAGQYEMTALEASTYRSVTKCGLAIRHWAEEEKLTALTVNFLAITRSNGFGCMPFIECCKTMARGVGYAGEGDVLTASLVGALLSVFPEGSFVEMFCPDWKNNLIFLSHMGEVNPAIISGKPQVKAKAFPYTDADDTASICGCFKAGDAVLVNLAPVKEGKYNLIISDIAIKDITLYNDLQDSICGWIDPHYDVSEFLEKYSMAGGTHHSAIVYGKEKRAVITFGEIMKWNVVDISK